MGVERIDLPRLKADLEALGRIGRPPGGGGSRPSFSDADMAARAWFLGRLRDAGLSPRVDGAGSIFAPTPEGGGPGGVGGGLRGAPGRARRDPAEIHAYLELHIEQGPVLERLGVPIGVVEAICGIRRLAVTF